MIPPAGSPPASAVPGLEITVSVATGCGIEVFGVTDGIITDVWNSSVMARRLG